MVCVSFKLSFEANYVQTEKKNKWKKKKSSDIDFDFYFLLYDGFNLNVPSPKKAHTF